MSRAPTILWFATVFLVACNPFGEKKSDLDTLDNLTNAKIEFKECGDGRKSPIPPKIVIANYPELEDKLTDITLRTYNAAPVFLQTMYAKSLGKIIIAKEPRRYCPAMNKDDDSFA